MIAGRRDHDDPALDHPFAFVADRRAPAGEIVDVVRDRHAEIGAVSDDERSPTDVHEVAFLRRHD